MKFQLLCFAVLFLAVSAVTAEFHCENGVPYKENYCNNCFCSDGNLGCTLMACLWVPEEVTKCQVGTTYTEDCNTCWCVENMGTICTAHKCSED